MKRIRGWVLWLGTRYINSKRNGRTVTPSLLSIGGIAVGVMALIAVLSVMNGLQLGFIEDILEINSYHIRIEIEKSDYAGIADRLRSVDGVESAAYFIDTQTLLQGEFSDYQAALVRGIQAEEALQDTRLMNHLNIVAGNFVLEPEAGPGVVIGDQMAFSMGVHVGDILQLVSMSGSTFAALRPQNTSFIVTGIFHSGYYQYDSSFCFIDIDKTMLVDTADVMGIAGVKIVNRFRDRQVAADIKALLTREGIDAEVESWRAYNRSFFRALRVEKLTMMILLGLIFLVVAVNIKNSLERSVIEKKEEIGILKALGSAPVSIRLIFLVEGGLIGSIGAACGLLLGLVISININEVFRLAEIVINSLMRAAGVVVSSLQGSGAVEIFSSDAFYMQQVPVRVLYTDVLLILMFAVLTSIGAAYAASRRIAEYRPSEILRNE